MQLYTEPNKYAQNPELQIHNNYVQFGGYQKFELSKYDIRVSKEDKGLQNKKDLFENNFNPLWVSEKSVLDLGCNSAFFCYYSRLLGAKSAIGIEIDKNYINNVNKANNYLDFEGVDIIDTNLMNYDIPADLVVAFALIHWIYSCTSDYGSLDLAIEKLASLTNEVLLIEWIEKEDEAIEFFKHIEYNPEVISEEYNRTNFENALTKHFSSFEVIGNTKNTRTVYIAYKTIITKKKFFDYRNNLNNKNFTNGNSSYNSFKTMFLDLLNDNYLSDNQIDNEFDNSQVGIELNFIQTVTSNQNVILPQLLLNDLSKSNLIAKQMTNYVVLSNWELILENKDALCNQTIEILLEENSFYTLGEKLSYLNNSLTKVLVRNDVYIEAIYLLNEKQIKIIAYNSTSDLFPENLVRDLFTCTKLVSFLKIPNVIDFVFYLIFKTVYILGASDKAISNLLKTISIYNNYELEKYNLSNMAFLNSILKSKKYINIDYNKLINSVSFEYLYSPDYVLNSRVVDSSTGRFYISRVYLNSYNDNDFVITKQANYNLTHKEFTILSTLNSEYFPKVKNYISHSNSSAFEMEFFDGSELKTMLLNDEIDLLEKLKITYQLIQIAKILNNNNIEHRDINPENIIIFEGNTKLIDFGWSKLKEENSYTPIGLNSEYSSYSINRKHIDVYSILLIIEELLICNILTENKRTSEQNTIGDLSTEELINEINNLKKASLTSTLRFTFSMLNILENLILTELAKAEKYSNVNMFSNDLTTTEIKNYNLKNTNNVDNIESQFNRDALYLYSQGNYLKAFEAINNALTINPENNDLFDLYIKINNKLKEIEILKLSNTSYENNIINNSNNNSINNSNNDEEISESIIQTTIDIDNIQDTILVIDDLNYIDNNNKEVKYQFDISIIIPVFNKIEYTKYCLDYLYKNTSEKYKWEVVIVDNGSNDGTDEYINNNYISKSNLSYIRNSYNMGFAKACNMGIVSRKGKDVILLNNDTLPLNNWLEAIMEEIEADSQIGVAGSCLLYPNTDLIQHIGVKIGTEDGKTITPYNNSRLEKLSNIENQSKYVSAVTGAVLYINSLVIEKIGFLDEIYINGLEDIDYCFKVINAGFKVRYCSGSKLYHYESITDGRHKWDIQNWQRLNRNWLGKIKFDESQYDTIKEVNSIKQRELNIDNITKENIKKLPTYEILKNNNHDGNSNNQNQSNNFVLNNRNNLQNSNTNINNNLGTNSKTNYYQNETVFSFIIPVHNNLEVTKKCINSIIQNTQNKNYNKQYEVIIIDNGSELETQKYLKNITNINDNFKLITNENNEIYSKVNNQGAKLAKGKYLIFLNNDVELLGNWFEHLFFQFNSDKNIGIQGIKLLYPNNKIQHAGVVWGNVGLDFPLHYHIYLTLDKNETCVNITREYQFVTGAFLSITSELFNQINGFDEKYVFGHEDLDLCLKVRQIGKKVIYNHSVEAIHYESQTKQLLGMDKFERFIKSNDTYDLANHKYFLSKWENTLISDAEKYFTEDGFWGLISDETKRNEFKEKIVYILEKIPQKDIFDNKEVFEQITNILFKSDKLPQNLDYRTLLTLSIGEVNKVLILIDSALSQNNNIEVLKDSPNSVNNSISKSINNFKPVKQVKKPLDILMTMWDLEQTGGGTLLPKQLAIQLAKNGNNVTIVFTSGLHKNNNTPYYVENTKQNNIDIYGIYNRKTNFLNIHNPELDIVDEEIIKIYEDIIKKKKPEIVHFHNFLGFSLEINNISKKYKAKTFYSPHNYFMIDPNLYMINNDLKKWSSTNFFENSDLPNLNSSKIKDYAKRQNKAKETLNSIDYILATSRKVGDLLSEINGNKDNIFLINHLPKTEKITKQINVQSTLVNNEKQNTDSKILKLKGKKLRIGYIGGVMAHKGVHNLILASKLLKNDIQINIYGFIIESYKKLLDGLQNQNIGNNNNGIQINYFGEYDQKDIANILSNVDCIVVCSIWEDCAPLVLAEALSQNTPIIAANIGGIPDFVVNNFNGLLYDYEDFNQLAKIIDDISVNFADDNSLLTKLTNNSKLTYEFDFYVNHIESIYLNVLNNINLEREKIELKFFDETENNKYWEEKLYLTNNNQNSIYNIPDLQHNDNQLNYTEASMNNFNSDNSLPKVDDSNINDMQPLNRITLDKKLSYGFSNNNALGKLPNQLPFPLKLNLGCGNDFKAGFINLDLFSETPDVVYMDIRNLEFMDNSVDYILASDVLEHFSHRETNKLLNEWSRVLKPGGEIEIRCPNLKLQIQAYLRGDWNADIASYMIFGGQTNPGDYHCIGFDENSIKNHLAAAGFEVTYYEELDYPQENGYINLNMIVKAKKMISELNLENSNSNSFTKIVPQKGTTYGENIDLDKHDLDNNNEDNLGGFNRSNDNNQNKNNLSAKHNNNNNLKIYEDINFEIVNLDKINKEVAQFTTPKMNVVWEGTQFVYHSLALVNREQCLGLINSGEVDLTIIPYEANVFDPTLNEKYHKLIANDIRYKDSTSQDLSNLPYVWIRHQWPPKNEVPLGSKWILMQPWEFTSIRKDFVETFNNVDEIWTPSNYCRKAFINSGIDPNKIQVIPNGINPEVFSPIGKIKKINTDKKLKFLFVGGTIPRKGIDILLSAYLTTFSTKDDVCLIIKDLGSDSFYKGQTAENLIQLSRENPNSAEIIYIDDKLSEEEMASLYRSCDVFVSPYRGEGFSLPTLEAMACGLPVIVTKGGATDDYVDEEIGWQIPSEEITIGNLIDGYELVKDSMMLEPNEEALKNVMFDIYKNPQNLKPLGITASNRARKSWTWQKSTLKILSRLDYLYNLDMGKSASQKLDQTEDIIISIKKAEEMFLIGDIDNALEKMNYCINYFEIHNLTEDGVTLYQYINNLKSLILIEYIQTEDKFNLIDELLATITKNENINKSFIDTLFVRVKFEIINKNLTEALEYLTICVTNWSDMRFDTFIGLTLDILLINMGEILFAMTDYGTAIQVFKSGLEINRYSELLHYNLGLAYKQIDNKDLAIKSFSEAIELNPNYYDAINELNEIIK